MPVFIHLNHPPYTLGGQPPESIIDFPFETTRAAASPLMSGALARWPDIVFILSHGGGTLPFVAPRIAGGISMDPALVERIGDPIAAMRRFWFDTALLTTPGQRDALPAIADPAQITYGTDFPMAPLPIIGMAGRAFARARLPEGATSAIAHNNAERLFS